MRSLLMLGLLLVAGAPAAAQWRVGFGLARERSAGFSAGVNEGEQVRFAPHLPLTWAPRVDRFGKRLGASFELRLAEPDLALEGPSVTIVPHGFTTTVFGLRPALALRLANLSRHVAVWTEAGPTLEIWSFSGEDPRGRVSGELDLYLDVGLGGRLSGMVGMSGAVTPSSPFEDDLPDGYSPRTGWRWGVRGALLYRLSGS